MVLLPWVWLLAAAACGVAVVQTALGDGLSASARLAGGLVVGWVLSTTLAFGVAAAMGRLDGSALTIQAVGTLALAWSSRRSWSVVLKDADRADRQALWLAAAASPGLIGLFAHNWLRPSPTGLLAGGSTWTDLGWHAAVSASFLFGRNFPPINPLLPDEPLRYYFFSDFHLAALMGLGMPFRLAAVVTGVALGLALVVLVHALAYVITRRLTSAGLAVALFLLNGGFGFIYFLERWRTGHQPLGALLGHVTDGYASNWTERLAYVNLLADALLPQRPLQYGLPLAVVVILVCAHLWRQEAAQAEGAGGPSEAARWRWCTAVGVLAGLLPMWQLFAWLAVVGLASLWALARPGRHWWGFFAGALLIAAWPVAWLTAHVGQAAVPYLQPGWMGIRDSVPWLFWVRNLGVPLLVAVPAWLALPPPWRAFLMPFAGLMAVAMTVMLSPSDFNNLKLMQYWQLANAIAVADWLRRLAGPPVRQRWLAVMLVVASTASGALDVVRAGQDSLVAYAPADVAAAGFIRQRTPPHAIFLTAPMTHLAPAALAGRRVVVGSTLYLWSHGLGPQAWTRVIDARRIFQARPQAEALIDRYRIDYLYVGPFERLLCKADVAALRARFPVVFARDGVMIFQTRRDTEHRPSDGSSGRSSGT